MSNNDDIWMEIDLLKEQVKDLQLKRERVIKARAQITEIAEQLRAAAGKADATAAELDNILGGSK